MQITLAGRWLGRDWPILLVCKLGVIMIIFREAFVHVFRPAAARAANLEYEEFSRKVSERFWSSGRFVLVLVVLALIALWCVGKIGPGLAWDLGKVASCVGNALLGWATWFALWDGSPSYKGGRPDELAREGIFRVLISLGVLLSVFGGGWWQ